MKKAVILSFLALSVVGYSQFKYGLRGGISYGSFGDLKTQVLEAATTKSINPKGSVGYVIGAYIRIDALKVYFRPEVVYSGLSNSYDNNSKEFSLSRFEFPMIVGFKFLPTLSLFGGPSIRLNKFSGTNLDSLDKTSLGAQLGVGIQILKFGFDIRYGFDMTEMDLKFKPSVTAIAESLNGSTSQIILSLSFDIN